jgi:hypothetical protein
VPVSFVLLAVILFQLEAPMPVWAVFGGSLGSWLVREVLRPRRD